MKQLKMYRRPQNLTATPIPAGCTVRNFRGEEDIPTWIAMCKEGILGPDAGFEAYETCILKDTRIVPERDIFFVELDSKPAATITGVIDPDTKMGNVHMVDSFPWSRGKGIGTFMMHCVLNHLVSHGMEWIQLTTDDFRLPAIRSYLRRGFVPVNNDEDMEERWTAICEKLGYSNVEMLNLDKTLYKMLCTK